MSDSPGMTFEMAMRMWFGAAAFGKAGHWDSVTERNKWLRKWVKALTTDILALETDETHRDRVLMEVDRFEQSLTRTDSPEWLQVFILIQLVGTLLGRLYPYGYPVRLVLYAFEAASHYFDSSGVPGALQELRDQPTIIGLRYEIVSLLRDRGFPDWRIAQVLNTSAYHLRKLDASFSRGTAGAVKHSEADGHLSGPVEAAPDLTGDWPADEKKGGRP